MTLHFISIDPAMHSGEPCINHTRVPLWCLAVRWWSLGDKTDCENYGCTWPDVLVACWYYGTYGTRTWKARYGAWAKEANDALWKQKYGSIADPPTKGARPRHGEQA